jgi:hypothetical protein
MHRYDSASLSNRQMLVRNFRLAENVGKFIGIVDMIFRL